MRAYSVFAPKGYDAEEDNTWEHEDNLDCEEALQMFRVKQIRKEVGDELLAELLVALVEILSQLPCCRAGERVLLQQSCHLLQQSCHLLQQSCHLLQQSCHLLQCGGCGEAWLHGHGCGRCRPGGAAGSQGDGVWTLGTLVLKFSIRVLPVQTLRNLSMVSIS